MFAVGSSGAADTKSANYAENEQICPESNDYVQKYLVFKVWRFFESQVCTTNSVESHGQARSTFHHAHGAKF